MNRMFAIAARLAVLTAAAAVALGAARSGSRSMLRPATRPAPPQIAPASPPLPPAPPVAATLPAYSISRALVEKIPLTSVMDGGPDANPDALIFPDVRTGVHFDFPTVAAGQPVTVTLVVHSLTPALTRAIKASVDLGGPGTPPQVGGSARLELARLSDTGGDPRIITALKPTDLQDAALAAIVLKPDDFWVIRGDVRSLAPNRSLSPGRYRLRFWVDGQRAQGDFTVTDAIASDAGPATLPAVAALQPPAMLFSLTGGWQARKAAAAGAAAEDWPMESPYPAPRTLDDFQPALALGIGEGPGERYYSRLADVPAADDTVAIAAELVDHNPSHLKVTLTPRQKGHAVPRYPSVYLLFDGMEHAPHLRDFNQREFVQTGDNVAFSRPIVIDITLPDQGNPSSLYQGKARLSVIVASDPVWYGPSSGDDSGNMPLGPNRPGRPNSAPGATRWTGMVKSLPVPITLPPPSE